MALLEVRTYPDDVLREKAAPITQFDDDLKQIARDMNATEVTIKMHMRAICHKLGAKNRTQAAVIALREQIL